MSCSWIARINIVKMTNDSTTPNNLEIQSNLYKNTNGIFHRTQTNKQTNKKITIGMKTRKAPTSQSSLEKEKRSWKTEDYTTKLQLSRQYGTGTKTEIYKNGTI